MRRKETGQLEFAIGPENSFWQVAPPDQPVTPEKEFKIDSLITLSEIEKIIYRDIEGVRPRNVVDASLAVGRAIDFFLVPTNFIYRFRSNYCFPPEDYPSWDLKTVFANFYPTGWRSEEILEILKNHRKRFCYENRPLRPGNSNLEKRMIKERLVPVWEEVAKKFRLDFFHLQQIATFRGDLLVASGQAASQETIADIGRRIVEERFYRLIDDDLNYSYLAKPDCLLVYQLDGQTFYIQVQPDYIKRLQERKKSVQKRLDQQGREGKAERIVASRIIGDYKDSDRKDLSDFSTPFGKTMLVYNWLLSQIGQRFKQVGPTLITLPNRQKRRVFIIPAEVLKPIPAHRVQTALEFLQARGSQIFTPMPRLTAENEELARKTFEEALAISRRSKITS